MRLEKEFRTYLNAPFGNIEIVANELALKRINFLKSKKNRVQDDLKKSKILNITLKQLKEYFSGKREEFDLPLFVNGTILQQNVWKEILNIPYGNTSTYKNISKNIKNPKACRAVGNAVGKNPIPIVIPCHRVIHSDGDIKGFSGGDHIKRFLLKQEGVI
jgi:methylated-DNA-[protein]-cysteine S-methyltransferase